MPDLREYLTDDTGTVVVVLTYIILIGINLLSLLSAAGKWKIYTKAGEAGWKSLVPLYNTWTDFRIAHSKGICPVYLLCMAAGYGLACITQKHLTMAAAALFLVGFVISSVKNYRLSRAFGHGMGFALGLIFINSLFTVILGFDRSRYRRGKKS